MFTLSCYGNNVILTIFYRLPITGLNPKGLPYFQTLILLKYEYVETLYFFYFCEFDRLNI